MTVCGESLAISTDSHIGGEYVHESTCCSAIEDRRRLRAAKKNNHPKTVPCNIAF